MRKKSLQIILSWEPSHPSRHHLTSVFVSLLVKTLVSFNIMISFTTYCSHYIQFLITWGWKKTTEILSLWSQVVTWATICRKEFYMIVWIIASIPIFLCCLSQAASIRRDQAFAVFHLPITDYNIYHDTRKDLFTRKMNTTWLSRPKFGEEPDEVLHKIGNTVLHHSPSERAQEERPYIEQTKHRSSLILD